MGLHNYGGPSIIFVVILFVLIIVIISLLMVKNKIETFDATGLVYNMYPNWFAKKPYNPADWVVEVYPDNIQPSCLSYDRADKWGSLEDINYNSQAYKFWRF